MSSLREKAHLWVVTTADSFQWALPSSPSSLPSLCLQTAHPQDQHSWYHWLLGLLERFGESSHLAHKLALIASKTNLSKDGLFLPFPNFGEERGEA